MKHRAPGRWEVAVATARCLWGEFGPDVQAHVALRGFFYWVQTRA